MIKLDLSAFRPGNLLSKWWPALADILSQLQDANNTLETGLGEVREQCVSDKKELLQKVQTEAEARKSADNDLSDKISGVDSRITKEISTVNANHTKLIGTVTGLGKLSHSHKNYDVIDGISAEDVDEWRTAAKQDCYDADKLSYFDEMCRDFSQKLSYIYNLCGICVYDGGIFGQEQSDNAFEGGVFDDTDLSLFDCGNFDETDVLAVVSAVDGGTY